jgi:hypothetical protein
LRAGKVQPSPKTWQRGTTNFNKTAP